MRTIGLVLHPTKPVADSVATILAAAHGRPVRVLARAGDLARLPEALATVPDERFVAEVDGVVALGGDGTMLATTTPPAARSSRRPRRRSSSPRSPR